MKYWNEAIFDELRKILKIYVRPLKFCIKHSFWNYWNIRIFENEKSFMMNLMIQFLIISRKNINPTLCNFFLNFPLNRFSIPTFWISIFYWKFQFIAEKFKIRLQVTLSILTVKNGWKMRGKNSELNVMKEFKMREKGSFPLHLITCNAQSWHSFLDLKNDKKGVSTLAILPR
jgi:hypothetical protein